jgi:hypothetical protein
MFFEGSLDPSGGVLRPDPAEPGHGLTPRREILARYGVGDAVRRQAQPSGGVR